MRMINRNKAMDLVSGGALLVDMRSPVDFRDGSITGAVNLPLKNFLNKIVGLDRKKKIVIFGRTVNDPDLKNACNYAEELGFQNLFVSEYKQLANKPEEIV